MLNKWNVVRMESGIEPAMLTARRICLWSAAQEIIDNHLPDLDESDQDRVMVELDWEIEREAREQFQNEIN